MSHRLQGSFQMRHTLAGPFEQAHWIAFRLKESFQIREQRGIFLAFLFAPTPFFSLSLSWGMTLALWLPGRDTVSTASRSRAHASADICLFDPPASCLKGTTSPLPRQVIPESLLSVRCPRSPPSPARRLRRQA